MAHLDFPATHRRHALALVIFNWAAWYCIKTHYENSPVAPSASSAARHIAGFAASRWRAATPAQHGETSVAKNSTIGSFGSTGTRTQAQKEAARAHAIAMIADAPPGATIAFTDGSASAIPPAAGAGAVITTGSRRREIAVALGTGTNNISEMWAIGAVATALARTPPTYTLLLTDSKISKDLANCKSRPTTNVPLVHAVRESVRKLRLTRIVHICWVAGHVGLDDNEAADRLADLARRRSISGKGMGSHDDYFNYDTGIDIYITPIQPLRGTIMGELFLPRCSPPSLLPLLSPFFSPSPSRYGARIRIICRC